MQDIKNKMTNLAGWLNSIGLFLIGLPLIIATMVTGLNIPAVVLGVTVLLGILCNGVAGIINSHYGGKNPDGTVKTDNQLNLIEKQK